MREEEAADPVSIWCIAIPLVKEGHSSFEIYMERSQGFHGFIAFLNPDLRQCITLKGHSHLIQLSIHWDHTLDGLLQHDQTVLNDPQESVELVNLLQEEVGHGWQHFFIITQQMFRQGMVSDGWRKLLQVGDDF